MNKKVRFSIITVSFNAEKTISKTIESILAQNYSDCEYVFVDGGSSDNTNKIIEEYKVKLNQKGIEVTHVSEKDRGISDAFNKGICLANGEIISILNADDQMINGTLTYLNDNFIDDIDILYGNCIWNDIDNGTKYIRKSKKNLSQLKYDMVIMHPATYVRKQTYEKYGVFDLTYKYCMDKELMYRMFKAGAKFCHVDKEFTLFQAGGVSDKNAKDTFKEGEKLAISYGEPFYKVKIITYRKIIKYEISRIMKKLSLNRKLT